MEKIKNIFLKMKGFILSHKILSIIILTVLVASPFVVSSLLPKKASVTYVTQAVKKSNISVSVSGTGQVSSLRDVDITSKVSGDLLSVYAKNGEAVNKGELLFKVNDSEGIKNVKTAELALESAELSLEKMKAPVDELTLLQAENSLIQANESKRQAENNLEKSYDDGFNNVSNAFLELPGIMTGLYDVLFSTSIAKASSNTATQSNIYCYADAVKAYDSKIIIYEELLLASYNETKKMYDQNFNDYKNSTRFSSNEDIESLIKETYDTTKKISDTIKAANNYIQFYKEILSDLSMSPTSYADIHLSTLSGYTGKTNSHLSTLLSSENSITNYQESIISTERSIKEKELSLEDTKEGYDDLEIRTQELAVEQKKEELFDAEDTLAEYYIRAPFDGIMASVDAVSGDTINSGTVMGSIITNEKIATITLNEVDVADVKVGQKVNITFDALDDLSITGEVAEVDTLGAVSQGVVSYNVKISFDTDNEKIKSGMSITADIIIESIEDVLAIPSAAVKTGRGNSYVEVMNDEGGIEKKNVETGMTDDTTTEIKSGLSEGEKVVVSTGLSTKKTTTTTTKSTTTNTQQGPGGSMDMMMITR